MKNCLTILVLCGFAAGAVFANNVYFVDGDFQGEHYTGKSWLSAFPTIQDALEAAKESGGEIWVKAGVYKPTEDGGRSATFRLYPGIRIYGGFRGNETVREQRNYKANRTILSGDIGQLSNRSDNSYHVVTGAPDTVIDGFIITGGNADGKEADGHGGGMLYRSPAGPAVSSGKYHAVISNCIFEKNNARRGGAVSAEAAAPEIRDCTFFSNSAETGGAVFWRNVSFTMITNCIFTSNYARKYGGAVAVGTEANIIHCKCTFLLNHADQDGGAVCNVSKSAAKNIRPVYFECSFSENSAGERGGAIASRGSSRPVIAHSRFTINSAAKGGGAVAGLENTLTSVFNCTFVGNRGGKGLADITQDDTARISSKELDIAALMKPPNTAEPKIQTVGQPEAKSHTVAKEKPQTPPLRQIDDVFVYTAMDIKMKLRTIISRQDYTVLVTGCLTEPHFLKTYRGVEAAARDYADKGVNFFYLYKVLAHPENNGYLKPYTLKERAAHVRIAIKKLRTRVPWLYDTMNNEAFVALDKAHNGLFIFDRNGQILYSSRTFDEFALRSQLRKLIGPVKNPTRSTDLALPDITPSSSPTSGQLERMKLRGENKTIPLEIVPQESDKPFYVKVRAEANPKLLSTGSGRMYLGFHVDPIYNRVCWNNLGNTLTYTIKVPRGTAISPSVNESPKVKAATDIDPREFMLEVRNWNEAQPHWTRDITQYYLVYLKKDEFGGVVFNRNLPEDYKPEKKPPGKKQPFEPQRRMPFRRPFFRRF